MKNNSHRSTSFQVILMLCVAFTMLRCSEDAFQKDLSKETVVPNDARSRTQNRVASNAFSVEITAQLVNLLVVLHSEGTITVDWGDGTSETIHIPVTEVAFFFMREHEYADTKPHVISLSDDLPKIIEVGLSTEGGNPTKLWKVSNLALLPALSTFSSESAVTIQELDFRNNVFLGAIVLPAASVKRLLLGDNNLAVVQLNGSKSNYDFDAIIDIMYDNAVENNITRGFIKLVNYGTLSPSSLEKISILEETYIWRIEI